MAAAASASVAAPRVSSDEEAQAIARRDALEILHGQLEVERRQLHRARVEDDLGALALVGTFAFLTLRTLR